MKFEFIEDLDDYFSEKYADYDRLCVLKGYVMPKMQASKRLENGAIYAYTLPANTMRLAKQANRAEILVELKKTFKDDSFSFSFRPISAWARFRETFTKSSFKKLLPEVLARYNQTVDGALEKLDVDEKTWKRICKGAYYPTKNLVFSLALNEHMSMDDVTLLMDICGFEFDYQDAKDVVISYLLSKKVFNVEMIRAALAEYKVGNLFVKGL
jgi:hypothetical protein